MVQISPIYCGIKYCRCCQCKEWTGIVIVDYKSDSKKADWTEEDFEKHLQKYDGQLMLYQYAMAKLFSVPVETVETRLYLIARKE